MRTKTTERPSLRDDESLRKYEAEVSQIVLRRVVQVLFLSRSAMKIADLIGATNSSINSVAEAFQILKNQGAVDLFDGRIALNGYGRRLVLKNRRRFFFPRVSVSYASAASDKERNSRGPNVETVLDGQLPDAYRLSAIDVKKTRD
ncbi:MAG: hypothetical protein AB1457_18580 [Chloroflexota bacterium]